MSGFLDDIFGDGFHDVLLGNPSMAGSLNGMNAAPSDSGRYNAIVHPHFAADVFFPNLRNILGLKKSRKMKHYRRPAAFRRMKR